MEGGEVLGDIHEAWGLPQFNTDKPSLLTLEWVPLLGQEVSLQCLNKMLQCPALHSHLAPLNA